MSNKDATYGSGKTAYHAMARQFTSAQLLGMFASPSARHGGDAPVRRYREAGQTFNNVFRAIAMLLVACAFSTWDVYDISDGRVTVTERSWWGMRCRQHSFAVADVADVSMAVRRGCRNQRRYAIVFLDRDKRTIFCGRFSMQSHAHNWKPKIKEALASGGTTPFHDWTYPHVLVWLACAVGVLLPTMAIKWRKR